MAQTVVYFSGLETGDLSEVNTTSPGWSAQTGTVFTGGYSLQRAAANNSRIILNIGMAATQMATRFRWRMDAVQATTACYVVTERTTSGVGRTYISLSTGQILSFVDASGGTLGTLNLVSQSTVLVPNRTYLVDWTLDLAAGGVMNLWLDGILEISGTHSADATGDTIDRVTCSVTAGASPGPCTGNWFYDDFRIDVGGVSRIGAGQCIARQGIAGTPTYDAWTKHGASGTNAYQDWSDTPFDTTNYCDDTSLNAYQTMVCDKFSTDPGRAVEGTQRVGAADIVNAVKVALVGNSSIVVAGAGAFNIRRRVGGTDTDSAQTFTTSDAYYQTALFTDTAANLDVYEIGAGHGNVAATHTVRDVWMMVDYTPMWEPQSEFGGAVSVLRQSDRMISY